MSIAKWRTHIEACQASGMSKSAYAKKHKLEYSQFIYWCKKYELYNQKRSDLIQVKIPDSQEPSVLNSIQQQPMGILEYPSGVRLHIHHPGLLKSLPDWRA